MGIYYGKADFINYGKPSLLLDFANKKSLTDRISGNNLFTFTRTSTGTYVGSDGLIKSAAVNEPRFDHNPVTGESLGLLIEEQRTNFIQESVPSASVDSYWLKRNLTNSQNIARGPNMLGIDIVPRSSTYSTVYMSYAWAGIETTQTYTNWTEPGVSIIPYRVSFLINPLTWTGNIFLQSQTYDGNPAFGSRITLFSGGNYVANSSFIKAIYSDGTYWIHNIYKPGNIGTSFKLGFTVDEQGNDSKKYWVSSIQMESGPQSTPAGTTPDPIFSTSYIPTTGSAATRTADFASITGSNLTSFYNQSQGTLFCRFRNFGYGDAYHAGGGGVSFDNSGPARPLLNLISLNMRRDGPFYRNGSLILANNTTFASSPVTPGPSNNISDTVNYYNFVGSFSSSRRAFTYNGITPGVDTASIDMPIISRFIISTNSNYLYDPFTGYISRISYYPSQLTDTQLQNLTR